MYKHLGEWLPAQGTHLSPVNTPTAPSAVISAGIGVRPHPYLLKLMLQSPRERP